jgi:GNAT superfamily N-acetyltransferase
VTGLPEGYRLTENPAEIDVAAAHAYLARSYWAENIPLATVAAAIENSFCIAIYHEGEQVGLARLISDFATFAYLSDVNVLEEHRGRGLASAMLAHLQGHPKLQGLRRWLLFTVDAQPLYEKAGWSTYPHPGRVMVRDYPDIYR